MGLNKRILANARHAVWNDQVGDKLAIQIQVVRIRKRIILKLDRTPCRKIGNMYFFQPAAILERILTDARHAVGNGDTRKAVAIIERRTSNARHAVRNNEVGDKFAIQIQVVRIIYRVARVTAKLYCTPCCNIGNMYLFQPGAIFERLISDARYAVWNSDARKTTAIIERRTSNTRHGEAFICGGDHNCFFRAANADDRIGGTVIA